MAVRRGPVYLLLSRHQSLGAEKRTPRREDQSARVPWISSPLPSPFPLGLPLAVATAGADAALLAAGWAAPLLRVPGLLRLTGLTPPPPLPPSGTLTKSSVSSLASLQLHLGKQFRNAECQTLPETAGLAKVQTGERALRVSRRLPQPGFLRSCRRS